jgi:phytoene dehydrogenase-like protein
MATTTSRYDTVVIGGGVNGLVAAIQLARSGARVALVERAPALGGTVREIELAPGFRAAPFGSEIGWMPPEIARAIGLAPVESIEPDPTVIAPAGDGAWLALRRDPSATRSALERFSPKDGAAWPAFCARLHRIAGFLRHLYLLPPPDIDTTRLGELWDLLQVGRKLKGLGKTEMVEVLRTVPMAAAELLDEWFEHEGLKGVVAASAVTDLAQGPYAGGTAFTLLHHHVGAALGVIRGQVVPRGGAGAVIAALADLAHRAGVLIRTGGAVTSIEIGRDDEVTAVRLDGGEELATKTVLSTADPRRTLLELVDPVHLDPEVLLAVRNVRFRGAAAKVLLALDGLPEAPGVSADLLRGAISISPSMAYLERAYDATKYGERSERPYVEARIPSLLQPELSPAGQHVMVLHVQYAPYRLKRGSWETERDALADAAVRAVEGALPGLSPRIRHRLVLTPPDLEREFGVTEGAVSHGELMLDQILFMRPLAGFARYAMPVRGLYLGGAGAHPGPGIAGAPGWLAARAIGDRL